MGFIDNSDPFFYFLGASALLKYVAFRNWNKKTPRHVKEVGKVGSLGIFPVKSMGGFSLDEMTCTFEGPVSQDVWDRQWTVTTIMGGRNVALTAKMEPALNLIRTKITDQGVELSASGMAPLVLSKSGPGTKVEVLDTVVCRKHISGLDCGDEAAEWLRTVFKKPDADYRMLYFDQDLLSSRDVEYGPSRLLEPVKTQDKIFFHDASPYFLLSDASVEDLNKRLGDPVVMDNFRPNLVVTGCKAYEEDFWPEIYIGDAKFSNYLPCDRCAKSLVDQETGTMRKDNEPLKTLRKYRLLTSEFREDPCFGRMLVLDRPGTIRVGDPVYALTTDKFIG